MSLEDYSKLLDSKPSPTELARQSDVVAGGIHDLVDRLANVEQANLEAQHRLGLVEHRLNDAETRAAGYAKDRDEYKKRLDAIEKTPLDVTAKLDAIEKRLRQVEGAVGSKNFTAEPPAAAKTDATPDAPKPGFMARTFGSDAPAPVIPTPVLAQT